MTIKLLAEHYLEFLILKGGCTGSFESTLVKMPHCWKSHVTAQIKNEIVPMDRLELEFDIAFITQKGFSLGMWVL